MAWLVYQYLNQCWPSSLISHGVTGPQWVNWTQRKLVCIRHFQTISHWWCKIRWNLILGAHLTTNSVDSANQNVITWRRTGDQPISCTNNDPFHWSIYVPLSTSHNTVWWLQMAWCLYGTRTSAIIMMYYASRLIAGLPQGSCRDPVLSFKIATKTAALGV